MTSQVTWISLRQTCATHEEHLCALQFSAHDALHVEVNVRMLNMTNVGMLNMTK